MLLVRNLNFETSNWILAPLITFDKQVALSSFSAVVSDRWQYNIFFSRNSKQRHAIHGPCERFSAPCKKKYHFKIRILSRYREAWYRLRQSALRRGERKIVWIADLPKRFRCKCKSGWRDSWIFRPQLTSANQDSTYYEYCIRSTRAWPLQTNQPLDHTYEGVSCRSDLEVLNYKTEETILDGAYIHTYRTYFPLSLYTHKGENF